MNAERISISRVWLELRRHDAETNFDPVFSADDIPVINDLLALLAAEESRLTWTPTAENINALPEPIRNYIHGIEALCDPAGIVRENVLVNDINAGLLRDRESRLTATAVTEEVREMALKWLRETTGCNEFCQANLDVLRALLSAPPAPSVPVEKPRVTKDQISSLVVSMSGPMSCLESDMEYVDLFLKSIGVLVSDSPDKGRG